MLDEQDLESLYGCKPREEDNYLTKFVIEAYLQLIATTSLSKGLNMKLWGGKHSRKGLEKAQFKIS